MTREIKEGDIIEFEHEVRTGTRKVTSRRGYDTYAIRKLLTIRAVVKVGQFQKYAHVMYYETRAKETYDSYFNGSGKKSDIPSKITLSLDSVLRSDVNYKIIGNVDENPEPLEE